MMKLGDLMVELYSDSDLMERFKADPGGVLEEKGAELPPDVTLKVLQDTAEVRHVILPYLTDDVPLEAEQLEKRASLNTGFPY